jgi:RimJ/RimL family protein N-acetyltransferase
MPWEDGRDEMEWGLLLKPEHWGKGLALEIGLASLEECFKRRGIRRVLATVEVDHLASMRLMRRLDFTRVGRCEDEDGGVYDVFAADHPEKGANKNPVPPLAAAS